MLPGLARNCRNGIPKGVSLPSLAPYCRVLRSRWCHSGVKVPSWSPKVRPAKVGIIDGLIPAKAVGAKVTSVLKPVSGVFAVPLHDPLRPRGRLGLPRRSVRDGSTGGQRGARQRGVGKHPRESPGPIRPIDGEAAFSGVRLEGSKKFVGAKGYVTRLLTATVKGNVVSPKGAP